MVFIHIPAERVRGLGIRARKFGVYRRIGEIGGNGNGRVIGMGLRVIHVDMAGIPKGLVRRRPDMSDARMPSRLVRGNFLAAGKPRQTPPHDDEERQHHLYYSPAFSSCQLHGLRLTIQSTRLVEVEIVYTSWRRNYSRCAGVRKQILTAAPARSGVRDLGAGRIKLVIGLRGGRYRPVR